MATTSLIPANANDMKASPAVTDAIVEPLTTAPTDVARGRAIVTNRQKGLCLLCHSGPFPDQPFQGNIGPSLQGIGSRLSEGQIRQRIVDSRRINPATIMPPYHSMEGLTRVGQGWVGKPILTAQDVEDVVAFLASLKDAP